MENFSEHRDRANKMDSHEVRTTHSMCVCVKYASAGGTRLVIRKSPVTIR
jgi:hypothetical protein